MLRCEKCQYEDVSAKKYPCSKCDSVTNDLFEPKKQTNADRIRSMSDEEFAEFWLKSCDNPIMEFNEDICDLCNTYKSRGQCDDEYCKEAIVKRLQSEVEVDNFD